MGFRAGGEDPDELPTALIETIGMCSCDLQLIKIFTDSWENGGIWVSAESS